MKQHSHLYGKYKIDKQLFGGETPKWTLQAKGGLSNIFERRYVILCSLYCNVLSDRSHVARSARRKKIDMVRFLIRGKILGRFAVHFLPKRWQH